MQKYSDCNPYLWRPRMTIKTPKFQGTHLWDRLCWAKENLEAKQSDYRIVWEDPDAILMNVLR